MIGPHSRQIYERIMRPMLTRGEIRVWHLTNPEQVGYYVTKTGIQRINHHDV